MTKLLVAIAMLTGLATIIAQAQSSPAPTPNVSPVSVSKTFIVTTNTKSVSWVTCLSFTNETQQTMQAIQFGFTYKDAFDTTVGSFHGDRVGEFSPGVLIEGPDNAGDYMTTGNSRKAQNCFTYPMVVGSIASVEVSILKVRYGDGIIWTNPSPTTVFSSNYMALLQEHPARLGCKGIRFGLTEPWWYVQQQLDKGNRYWQNCYKTWLNANQLQPTSSPSPPP